MRLTPSASPEKLNILVCSANMGNQQPDEVSLNAWIPKDGLVKDVLENQRYPLGNKNKKSTNGGQGTPIDPTKKFDIVVIGMQESTFEVEDESGQKFKKSAFKGLSGLTRDKDHLGRARKQLQKKMTLDSLPSAAESDRGTVEDTSLVNSSFAVRQPLSSVQLDELQYSDTNILHHLFQDQLPSYTQAISYQRGQMRLMLFYNEKEITLDVLSLKAQNTGRAGLANKGGIVAEVNVNSCTRIAFLTAHLEAHEGLSKYATRCTTAAEIFRGTTSTVTKCRCDASLSSHFMFAMGDLNFRTRLPEFEAGSDEHIAATHILAIKKDWRTLQRHDELTHALKEKDCFAGFHTPPTHFPPTFKVHRAEGYTYNEKRSPSYTDRILYKASHRLWQRVKTLAYEPVDDFVSSDHKPIRGVFEVELNTQLKWRPTLTKRESVRALKRRATKKQMVKPGKDDTRDYFHMFVSAISCDLDPEPFKKSDYTPSPYVCFVSTPEDAIKKDSTKWEKLQHAMHQFQTSKKQNTERKQYWPRTKSLGSTFNADWDDQDVHFKIRTHQDEGLPIDLTGAMMHIAVFDSKNNSKLVGSFTLNLAHLIQVSRERDSKGPQTPSTHNPVGQSLVASLRASVLTAGFGRNWQKSQRNVFNGSSDPQQNTAVDYPRPSQSSLGSRTTSPPDKAALSQMVDRQKPESAIKSMGVLSASTSSYSDEEDAIVSNTKKTVTTSVATKGPSDALRNAANSLILANQAKRKSVMALRTAALLAGDDGHAATIDSLNIQSMRLNEALLKNGKEVGRIRCTIDSWWLNDATTDKKKQRRMVDEVATSKPTPPAVRKRSRAAESVLLAS